MKKSKEPKQKRKVIIKQSKTLPKLTSIHLFNPVSTIK